MVPYALVKWVRRQRNYIDFVSLYSKNIIYSNSPFFLNLEKSFLSWASLFRVTFNVFNLILFHSDMGKLEVNLVEKQRYYLVTYQRGKARTNGWTGVGVVYPNGTEELPMTSTFVTPC